MKRLFLFFSLWIPTLGVSGAAPGSIAGDSAGAGLPGILDLQPRQLVVIPLESMPALGLFTLTNFGNETESVRLIARGRVEEFQLNEVGDPVVRLNAENPPSESRL